MANIKRLLLYLFAAIVSFVVVLQFYPFVHPYSGLHPTLDASAVEAKATEILSRAGVNTSEMALETKFRANIALVRQTEQTFGRPRSNELLRSVVPGYFWEVNFKKRKAFSLSSFTMSSSDDDQRDAAREIIDALKGDINLKFSQAGSLLEATRKVADSTKIPSVSAEEAWKLAGEFLYRFLQYQEITDSGFAHEAAPGGLLRIGQSEPLKFENQKKTEQPHRTDYEFLWTTHSPELNDKIEVRVTLSGNAVSSAKVVYVVPEEFEKKPLESTRGIALAVVYVALFILMLVAVFKRIRSSEIGFRTGTFVGVIYAVAVCYQFFIELPPEADWTMYIPLPFIAGFGGAGVLLLWAVSESLVRETWREKFISLDILRAGYIRHSRVGSSIVRGIGIGAIALAAWTFLLWLVQQFVPVNSGFSHEAVMRFFAHPYAALQVVSRELYVYAYPFVFFYLFLMPFLKQRIASPWIFLPIAALAYGLTNLLDVQPAVFGVLVFALTGVVLFAGMLKFDVLTAMISLVTVSVFNDTALLISSGHPAYAASGSILIALWTMLMAWGFVAVGTKDAVVDLDSITPAFARYISERQRLTQELEIARSVQMSFLPKSNPTSYSLDIASRCAPALEVGGDYYDFIELDKKRLGVAVGDVSGKGTQAAFYMTLTKGFLRALTRVSQSPADVLSRVNSLFYENVDRGVFISLVFGIFDLGKRSVTVARAGHNPLIVRKAQAKKVELISPVGLALGLDGGRKFSSSIEQQKIAFQAGDLFVFYTDGFPEAMNKAKEEFGEERLLKAVEKLADRTSKEILDGIFAEMKSFAGKAPQHDDMTIVVVKVK
ncbi:MAG: PP2C family protein-serine/threonine phosphatase [Ignavibacteriales bacterium]|nr:PP2C family protein-serine/threonine phosphatase [Ignavibacteriales bacterium]